MSQSAQLESGAWQWPRSPIAVSVRMRVAGRSLSTRAKAARTPDVSASAWPSAGSTTRVAPTTGSARSARRRAAVVPARQASP